MSLTKENGVCQHFKYGFCKFGNSCKFKHIKEECKEHVCEIQGCEKRHPIECKYFRTYQRCKFGSYCLYKHLIPQAQIAQSNLKHLEEKIENIDAKLSSLTETLNERIGKIVFTVDQLDIFKKEREMKSLDTEKVIQQICDSNNKLEIKLNKLEQSFDESRDDEVDFLKEFYTIANSVEGLEERILEIEIKIPLIDHLDVKFHTFVKQMQMTQSQSSQSTSVAMMTPPSSSVKKRP